MRLFRPAILVLGIVTAAVALAQTKAAAPTIASAKAFMDRAEAELLKLSTLGARAEWVVNTERGYTHGGDREREPRPTGLALGGGRPRAEWRDRHVWPPKT